MRRYRLQVLLACLALILPGIVFVVLALGSNPGVLRALAWVAAIGFLGLGLWGLVRLWTIRNVPDPSE